MRKVLKCSAAAFLLSSSIAAAATVTVDFDTGSLSGGVYSEDGFTFTSDNPGGAGTANNCPTGSPNSDCLQFNNDEIITVTYMGGLAFDVVSFLFNAPGNGGDIFVGVAGGSSEFQTETNNGTTMTASNLVNSYSGVTSFFFQNAGNGSGRVDNIVFEVPDVSTVPIPASGVLLLAGLAGLGAVRRKS